MCCPSVSMYNAAMNIGLQVCLPGPPSSSSGYIPQSGVAQSHGDFIFNFLRNCCTVFVSVSCLLRFLLKFQKSSEVWHSLYSSSISPFLILLTECYLLLQANVSCRATDLDLCHTDILGMMLSVHWGVSPVTAKVQVPWGATTWQGLGWSLCNISSLNPHSRLQECTWSPVP